MSSEKKDKALREVLDLLAGDPNDHRRAGSGCGQDACVLCLIEAKVRDALEVQEGLTFDEREDVRRAAEELDYVWDFLAGLSIKDGRDGAEYRHCSVAPLLRRIAGTEEGAR